MEVQAAVAQVVSTLGTSNKCFECSIDTYHDWVRYDNDHHVSKTDCCQMSCVIHVCYKKHTDLVLNLNQEKAQNRGDRKAHELFDRVRDIHNFFNSSIILIELKTCNALDISICFFNNFQLIRRCNSLGK